ncbi:hypothetical protein D3C81_1174730 [compost metagenome]
MILSGCRKNQIRATTFDGPLLRLHDQPSPDPCTTVFLFNDQSCNPGDRFNHIMRLMLLEKSCPYDHTVEFRNQIA